MGSVPYHPTPMLQVTGNFWFPVHVTGLYYTVVYQVCNIITSKKLYILHKKYFITKKMLTILRAFSDL